MAYITTSELADSLRIKSNIPSWDIGSTPTKEEVGTGDGSTLVFYLDQKNILASTYTFYYGASEAVATSTLTETTHYSLNLNTGKITLTTTGRTLLSTNKLFAEYSYCNNGLTDSQLSAFISKAESKVNNSCNTRFTDSTVSNPSYPVRIDLLNSQGMYNKSYFVKKRPIIDIEITLSAGINDSVTSIALSSGDGAKLPTSGYILIDSEIVSYTGISTNTLTGCSRGQLNSTAATHLSGAIGHTTIVRISTVDEASANIWQVLAYETGFYIDEDTGKIYIYANTEIDNITADVPNRVEIIYYFGFDSIPDEIKRLTIIYAIQMLFNDTITKSLFAGRNEFNPGLLSPNKDEIDSILNNYRQLSAGNT